MTDFEKLKRTFDDIGVEYSIDGNEIHLHVPENCVYIFSFEKDLNVAVEGGQFMTSGLYEYED